MTGSEWKLVYRKAKALLLGCVRVFLATDFHLSQVTADVWV